MSTTNINRNFYTEAEDEFLIANYQFKNDEWLSDNLKRSIGSIIKRRNRLKLNLNEIDIKIRNNKSMIENTGDVQYEIIALMFFIEGSGCTLLKDIAKTRLKEIFKTIEKI